MPYVTKDQLHKILSDLPDHQHPGRNGRPAQEPTAARVARVQVDLDHLKESVDTGVLAKIRSKYQTLPDVYWQDNPEAIITPDRFTEAVLCDKQIVQQPSKSKHAKLWEICAGSGALSARAREKRVPHLPPVDLRYGWYTHRRVDQILILYGILMIGVFCVVASPNCAPWSQMTRNMAPERLVANREREGPGLKFLAMVCFIQFLLGRHFLIENSAASEIFQKSPLQILERLSLHASTLDQCMYGAKMEHKAVKKSTKFVSDAFQKGLDICCDRSHEHVQLRGHAAGRGSRAAMAARFPEALCDSIIESIGNIGATSQDGGRTMPSHVFVPPDGFEHMQMPEQVVHRLKGLRAVAQKHGYEDVFKELVDTWIAQEPLLVDAPKAFKTSSTVAPLPQAQKDSELLPLDRSGGSPFDRNMQGNSEPALLDRSGGSPFDRSKQEGSGVLPLDTSGVLTFDRSMAPTSRPALTREAGPAEELAAGEVLQVETAAPESEEPVQQPEPAGALTVPVQTRSLEDLFSGELPEEPWQHKRYSPDNRIWQAAAMRKRQHSRRSNVSLGVCTVDLSGPHEPSPRPGKQIHRDTVTYFLVLTVRPDRTAERVDAQTQTDDTEPAGAVSQSDEQPDASEPPRDRPLIYAALLGSKAEAAEAIKGLLAKVNDDHGNLPHTLFFRLHSDRGGDFVNDELEAYCREHAIHKTTTQGHDPNANASAEWGVGVLKRRCRYLLSGNRLPTSFWGVGVLAAAQIERAEAGVGSYPRIPFGTRGMLVTSPAPRSSWTPRAEPCTIFGSCDHISDAQWVYQKGWIKPRTDLQPQGLSQDDLTWVKLNVGNWDAPDRPLDLPPRSDYDAAEAPRLRPWDLPAATRNSATCEACLQTRRGRRQTLHHNLVWGECLHAVRPTPPVAEEDTENHLQQPAMESVDPELRAKNGEEEQTADNAHSPNAAAAKTSKDPSGGFSSDGGDEHSCTNISCREVVLPTGGHVHNCELVGTKLIESFPHAMLCHAKATSTAATWGSASSMDGESTTQLGEDDFQDLEDLESNFIDDDEVIVTPTVPSEGLESERAQEAEQENQKDELLLEAEADVDEEEISKKKPRRRKHKPRRDPLGMAKFVRWMLPAWCAMVATNSSHAEHVDMEGLDFLQQVAGPEPGKHVVPPSEVRQAVGSDLEAWIIAGQAEHDTFITKEAVQVATEEEQKAYGKRPLPMLNVWSRTDTGFRKCRSCIAGNFQELDPAAQRWTAQAEPSSIFAAAKLAALRKWLVSKLDVKGAFLNAPLPKDELILVQPPAQWVAWGIVPTNVVWKLNRAVYGLRQSPKWWSDERDSQLRQLTFKVGEDAYSLHQNEADSQVWELTKQGCEQQLQGLILVYVDDFLLMAPPGPVRNAAVQAIKALWEFGEERMLTMHQSLTFLGI